MAWALGVSAYLALGATITGWFLYGAGHRDAVDYMPRLASWRVILLHWAGTVLWFPAVLTWLGLSVAEHHWCRRRG